MAVLLGKPVKPRMQENATQTTGKNLHFGLNGEETQKAGTTLNENEEHRDCETELLGRSYSKSRIGKELQLEC
jgi:hypothetical protein